GRTRAVVAIAHNYIGAGNGLAFFVCYLARDLGLGESTQCCEDEQRGKNDFHLCGFVRFHDKGALCGCFYEKRVTELLKWEDELIFAVDFLPQFRDQKLTEG